MSSLAATRARDAFARYSQGVKQNFFDAHLQSLVRWHIGVNSKLEEELTTFGRECAGEIDDLARENNRLANLPQLKPYDGFGNLIEEIVFPKEYHELGRLIYRTGIMSRYQEVGKEYETLCMLYLVAQNGEAGHTCPLACTAGLIKSLQAEKSSNIVEQWLERLYDPCYDTHFHGSQFLTEVQGGSDVGANVLTAKPSATYPGSYELWGEKWFCSVVDAHLWLVVARPEGAEKGTKGLNGFVVPRTNPHTSKCNNFRIRRLKDKLGTRSMASAEIDFQGTVAHRLSGDFRDILQRVINTSRLYNAVVSSGMIQRCYLEAVHYAACREAFGKAILSIPAVMTEVAALRAEAYAARAVSFFIASSKPSRGIRMLTNLNKYWTAAAATRCAHKAIDVLGGNGAIEEFSALPRILRDTVVCAQWEGPHTLLCGQALKDAERLSLHEAMFDLFEGETNPATARLQHLREQWASLLKMDPSMRYFRIRSLVDATRPAVAAFLLYKEASSQQTPDPVTSLAAEHLLADSDLSVEACARIRALAAHPPSSIHAHL